jgi:peptidoglycan/xylan/chitin deacetylase (PgdA/CDA1 family)
MMTSPAFLLSAPFLLGGAATVLFGCRNTPDTVPPGLLFHSILPKPGLEMSHVSLHRFKRFCALLSRRNLRTLTVSEAFSESIEGNTGKQRCLLTFDDGFQSVITSAAPALQENNLKATIFCLGNHFGMKSQWDIYSGNTHLTKEEIRSLSDMGHEIGSHSMTHAYLPFLDDSSVWKELEESKMQLEDICGKAVNSLSFPYGGWNQRIWDIAREVGYTAATLYRGHFRRENGQFPVFGVYQNDTPEDMLGKLSVRPSAALLRARSRMMAHFARGTPVWKYRKEYHCI